MLRYAITDSRRWGTIAARRESLLRDAERWAREGIDFIQLREKDLSAGDLYELAQSMREVLTRCGGETKLLVNGRADVALAAGADGVHLSSHSDELTVQQVRAVFAVAGSAPALVSVSCHSLAEVARARDGGADLLLFGPVFEKQVEGKRVAEGAELALLAAACQIAGSLPVLALGGVTADNLGACMHAGAAGVAAIRLFQ